MRGTLVLAVLGIKSSYSCNLEIPLNGKGDAPDTLQWWFGDAGCWRIRTYALDHDIHVHQVADSPQTTVEFAKRNNLKHYGDVIKSQHVIDLPNWAAQSELETEFQRIGLVPHVEVDIKSSRFVFWKPDDAMYSTKSTPK